MNERVKLPVGYHIDWAGEYESQKRSQHRLMIVLPLTILGIFVSLYAMFSSAKWALLILANVAMAPVGGLLALLFTGTHFSVFRAWGSWRFSVFRCKPASSCWIHQSASRAGSHD